MPCYFIAQIDIHNPREYQRYLDECDAVFAKHDGEYLAVDTAPTVLEGDWPFGRVVLIRFPSEIALRRWYESPEYQRILAHRLKGARCVTIAANGPTQEEEE